MVYRRLSNRRYSSKRKRSYGRYSRQYRSRVGRSRVTRSALRRTRVTRRARGFRRARRSGVGTWKPSAVRRYRTKYTTARDYVGTVANIETNTGPLVLNDFVDDDTELQRSGIKFFANQYEEGTSYGNRAIHWGTLLNVPYYASTSNPIHTAYPHRTGAFINVKQVGYNMRFNVSPKTAWQVRVLVFTTFSQFDRLDNNVVSAAEGAYYGVHTYIGERIFLPQGQDDTTGLRRMWYLARPRPMPEDNYIAHRGNLRAKSFKAIIDRHYIIENRTMRYKVQTYRYHHNLPYGEATFRYRPDVNPAMLPAEALDNKPTRRMYMVIVASPLSSDGLLALRLRPNPNLEFDDLLDIEDNNRMNQVAHGLPGLRFNDDPEPLPGQARDISAMETDDEGSSSTKKRKLSYHSRAVTPEMIAERVVKGIKKKKNKGKGKELPTIDELRINSGYATPVRAEADSVPFEVPPTPGQRNRRRKERYLAEQLRNDARQSNTTHNPGVEEPAEPEEPPMQVLPLERLETGFSVEVDTHFWFYNRYKTSQRMSFYP